MISFNDPVPYPEPWNRPDTNWRDNMKTPGTWRTYPGEGRVGGRINLKKGKGIYPEWPAKILLKCYDNPDA